MILRTSFSPKFWRWLFPLSIFPVCYNWFCSTWYRELHDLVSLQWSIYSSLQKNLGKTMPGGHSKLLNSSFGSDLRKWDGPRFLNPSSKHPAVTSSWLAEDECASCKAQKTACWSPPPLRSQRLGWTNPHCRDCWVSEKVRVQEEAERTSRYCCFFSPTCSLNIVVEDAGIHLGGRMKTL